MRIVLDYEKRYCNICECVIDRLDMVRHRQSKKRNRNYSIDGQLENLPKFVFVPLQIPPSTTRHATQKTR